MRREKRFMSGILGMIAFYVVTITATASLTKDIGKSSVEVVNVVSQEQSKEEKNEEVNQVLPLKEIKISEKEKAPEKKIAYTINYKTPIYSEPNGKVQKDSLKKAMRVEVLEDKVVEITKETKVKKEDGTFTTKKNVEKSYWKRIVYGKNNEMREGWIRTGSLTEDVRKVIPANLKNANLSAVPKREYVNNPKIDVRGIYLTVNTAASAKRIDELIELSKRTKINAFVIDVKEDFGKMLFKTDAELKYLGKNDNRYPISDIHSFMKKLKDNNIYTIARIVSFKDPTYASKHPEKAIIKRATGKPFTNSDGVIWVSPHDRYLWEYNIAVAKEAAKAGFNEIQFDYVRFPASNGGKLDKELDYRNTNGESKPETIQKYLKYARKELEPLEVYISADIYGQVSSSSDDMGLGQHWEIISNEVDAISPMAYPSHYGRGVYGLAVPDAEPYKTIYYTTLDGINRNYNLKYPADIRPWLQAFTAKWVKGYIPYGKKEIEAQIKALDDLEIKQYLLWSPSNRYGIIEK
ncbi:putative glycoside hydrolase [Fusobacterium sp. SYSU M8A802]